MENAMLVSRGTAQAQVQEAIVLTSHLPEVLNALGTGSISWDQMRVMIEPLSAIIMRRGHQNTRDRPCRELYRRPDDYDPAPGGTTGPAAGIDILRGAADGLVEELVDRARFSKPAQLRSYGQRRRRELGAPVAERAHRMARTDRNVWVTSEYDEATQRPRAALPRGVRGRVTVAVPADLLAAADPDVLPEPPASDASAPASVAAQATGEPAAQILG